MGLIIEYHITGITASGFRLIDRHAKSVSKAYKVAGEILETPVTDYKAFGEIMEVEIMAEEYTPVGHEFVSRTLKATLTKPDFEDLTRS